MATPSISAVVCTRNRSEMIGAAITSILANTHPDFEVILIDQSTNDETQQAIADLLSDPRFRYIHSNTVGKGRACNIGLREARGDVVAYTDDDCLVPPDWLEQLEQPFTNDPQIALVFCSVLMGEHDPTTGYIPNYPVKKNRTLYRVGSLLDGIGLGAGMAVRKSILEVLGGFDTNLGPGARFMSGEDHDIAIRMLLNKYRVYEMKDVSVIHYGFRSWKEGRSHSKRDLFACGATYIKPLRCGYLEGTTLLFSKPIWRGFFEPFQKLLTFQKPQGLFRIVYFLEGVVAGLKMPVIPEKLLYRDTCSKVTGETKVKHTEDPPLVSIGLAVYNGEKYLEEAIRSILAQTYTNFELIISDNASTDRTQEICTQFAQADSRIRYHRNPTNIGGANNENLTFTYAKGKYFRWAAHDDVLDPQLLEKCVQVLEENPDVVLCHSFIVVIDAHGNRIKTLTRKKAHSSQPSQRFIDLTEFDHDCEETYGLMRSEVLQKTGLQRNYTDSDRTLLAHMSLYGQFYQIPEPLFYKRVHPDMSTQVFWDWRQRMTWFGSEYQTRITLPHWMQLFHYLEVISTSPISSGEKLRCFSHIPRWIISDRRWRWLGKDLVLAGYRFSRKLMSTSLNLAKTFR